MLKDKQGNYEAAIKDIKKCMALAKKCNIAIYIPNILQTQFSILKNNGKYKEALSVLEKVYFVTDSIGFRKENQKTYEMQLDYEKQIKVQENKSLQLFNLKEKELVLKQKWALVALIFGLLILIIFSGYLFKLNKKLKQNALTIAQNNKDLKRLNLLNQKIFTVISHDFKAPITTLRLFLKSEKITKNSSPMFEQYVNEANFQLDQSDAMMNNLLDWAKMELNLATGTVQTDLLQTINQTINELVPKAAQKNIDIINKITTNITVNFPAEVVLIVLRNLLSNALKFSFEDGIIEISFENNCIQIRDFGKGISHDKLSRLLKSDVEAGFGTKLETGFGIGLYLSNELMVKYGGFITASNNDNGGCSFFVHFLKNQ